MKEASAGENAYETSGDERVISHTEGHRLSLFDLVVVSLIWDCFRSTIGTSMNTFVNGLRFCWVPVLLPLLSPLDEENTQNKLIVKPEVYTPGWVCFSWERVCKHSGCNQQQPRMPASSPVCMLSWFHYCWL
jgi:hypothetical protein